MPTSIPSLCDSIISSSLYGDTIQEFHHPLWLSPPSQEELEAGSAEPRVRQLPSWPSTGHSYRNPHLCPQPQCLSCPFIENPSVSPNTSETKLGGTSIVKTGQSSRDMSSTSLMAYCKASNYLSLNEQSIYFWEESECNFQPSLCSRKHVKGETAASIGCSGPKRPQHQQKSVSSFHFTYFPDDNSVAHKLILLGYPQPLTHRAAVPKWDYQRLKFSDHRYKKNLTPPTMLHTTSRVNSNLFNKGICGARLSDL